MDERLRARITDWLARHCPGAELLASDDEAALRRGTAVVRLDVARLERMGSVDDELLAIVADGIRAGHPIAESSAARYLLRYLVGDDVRVVSLAPPALVIEARGVHLAFDLSHLMVAVLGVEHGKAQVMFRRAASAALEKRQGCRVLEPAEVEALRASRG
jgi:hypothetical protein